MKRLDRPIVCTCLLICLTEAQAVAQSTQSQRFVVHVPPRVVVHSPTEVAILGDGNTGIGPRARQTWSVAATSPAGVTVSFRAHQADQNSARSTHQADTRLTLSVGESAGAALWTVADPQHRTNRLAGANQADVQVSSNSTGTAELQLDVALPGGHREWLSDGDMTLTVRATVTSHD